MSGATIKPRGDWQRQVVAEITEWEKRPVTRETLIDLSNKYEEMIRFRLGEARDAEGRKVCRAMMRAADALACQ